MQQQAATLFAEAEAAAGAELPQFVKDDFDAFLEFGRSQVPNLARAQVNHRRSSGRETRAGGPAVPADSVKARSAPRTKVLGTRRQCYGIATGIRRDCYRAHLRRSLCVFLRSATSALRLLLGSSIGMASDASRP